MPRTKPSSSLLSTLMLLAACHAPPTNIADVDVEPPALEPEPEPAPTITDTRPRAELDRGVGHHARLTEVVLDPRGEAALTLDADGGVRLWPQLAGETLDPALAEPYRIPVEEPLWLSLARGEGGFTLGFIATNNAATIYSVELPESGPATIVERFSITPEDPLLELHVLDGGERILALGIDHRVRLYSRDGELVSVIDERGFGPWQLRVRGGVGEAPKLAAVLAQPLRVQPLRLVDDRLEIAGPARTVELDRGPNRNDLELSPDGRTVAALRRPHKHGKQWSVELIDLETDERALVAGSIDTPVRPRMHFVADDRIVLESGSGRAYPIDLGQAVAPTKREDLHPDSKFAKRLARELVEGQRAVAYRLPASDEDSYDLTEHDTGLRMHASVHEGVRANIGRGGAGLVVGAWDQPRAHQLAHPRPTIRLAALDGRGEQVVWVGERALYVEAVGAPGSVRELAHPLRNPIGVGLLGEDRLALIDMTAVATVELESGAVVAEQKLARWPEWDRTPRFVGLDGGAGLLAYASRERDEPVELVELAADGSLQIRTPDPDERRRWADIGATDGQAAKRACAELELACPSFVAALVLDHAGRPVVLSHDLVIFDGGATAEVELPAGMHGTIVASPAGPQLAVLTSGRASTLSLVDTDAGAVVWSQAIELPFGRSAALSWSADGARLAVVDGSRGQVFARADGRLLHTHEQLPLTITELSEAADGS